MPREALLLLAWLAPLLAFPTAAPDTTASYLESTSAEASGFTQSTEEQFLPEEGITKIFAELTFDPNGGEVTTSGSRGRRSEYIEYDSVTEEDYMTGMSRELHFFYPSACKCFQPTASQLPSVTHTSDSYSV